MSDVALRCTDVSVTFGALRAVDGVSHSFARNRLYSIIGPNGAGKTTFMNALSGRLRVNGGNVLLRNEDITHLTANQRTLRGLGRSFQITKIFPGMTVFENLRLAAQSTAFRVQPFWRPVGSYAALERRAEAVLAQIGLSRFRNMLAENLSHGDQRALEVGLTLMTEPEVLLLDEPLAGVGHQDIGRAVRLIQEIAKGRTVLLIEHNMDVVMSISEEVIVMVAGQIIAAGPPHQIKADPKVRSAYLGEE